MSFSENTDGDLIYISPPTNNTWLHNDPNEVEYDPLITNYSGMGGIPPDGGNVTLGGYITEATTLMENIPKQTT